MVGTFQFSSILAHMLLNLQSLKSQNKWFIPDNPIGLASILNQCSHLTLH